MLSIISNGELCETRKKTEGIIIPSVHTVHVTFVERIRIANLISARNTVGCG